MKNFIRKKNIILRNGVLIGAVVVDDRLKANWTFLKSPNDRRWLAARWNNNLDDITFETFIKKYKLMIYLRKSFNLFKNKNIAH